MPLDRVVETAAPATLVVAAPTWIDGVLTVTPGTPTMRLRGALQQDDGGGGGGGGGGGVQHPDDGGWPTAVAAAPARMTAPTAKAMFRHETCICAIQSGWAYFA